jgi:hypothetical protein
MPFLPESRRKVSQREGEIENAGGQRVIGLYEGIIINKDDAHREQR